MNVVTGGGEATDRAGRFETWAVTTSTPMDHVQQGALFDEGDTLIFVVSG